jgi:hypothetical protein
VIEAVTQGVGLVQVDTAVAQQPGLEAMGVLAQCTPASLRLRCTSRSSLALRWRCTSELLKALEQRRQRARVQHQALAQGLDRRLGRLRPAIPTAPASPGIAGTSAQLIEHRLVSANHGP